MPPLSPPRFSVLGTAVHALNLEQACSFLLEAREGRHLGYVCCCTAHGVVEARENPELRQAYQGASLVTPDGMPLVWLAQLRGYRGVSRVYGPDLLALACDRGRKRGLTHAFYGGAPGVAEALASRLSQWYPGLRVVATGTAPFRPLEEGEKQALTTRLAEVRPDLLWVGLGAPKQECFMAEMHGRLEVGLMVGVGAAFDFFSGRVRQAPPWVQRSGFEWLYRLCQEPRRLAARYWKTTPRFAGLVALEALGLLPKHRSKR